MASLKRWINDRAKQAQGVYHQANMWDGGRTYDTNQRGVAVGTPNPINVRNDNTRGFQLSNNSLTRGASRAFDQANPLDSGRTWKQRTPVKLDMSVLDQARKNGATNLVGNSILKPLVRTSMAISQGPGNLGTMAAGGKAQNADEFYGKKFTNLTGYTGTKQQIAGDAITNVANIAMPGSSTVVKGAFKSVAPKVVPSVVNRAVANAGVGAVGGGVSNLGAELSNDRIKSFKDALGAVTTGAQFGAAIGAGGTLALPVVKAGAKGTQKSAQIAKELPAKQNARLESAIVKRDPELNERVSVTRPNLQKQYDKGSAQQRKQVERAIAENEQAIRNRINKTKQGGYARLPIGDRDPAPDLSPKQKEFINDYAEMLEGMDSSNGVSLVPDGEAYGYGKKRVSSNSPTYSRLYEENGGKPSKQQWFDEARQQIESGKAGFGASDAYTTLPKLSRADATAKPNSGRKALGKEKLETFSSKNTIDPLESLKQEARKYRSADEFDAALSRRGVSIEKEVAQLYPNRNYYDALNDLIAGRKPVKPVDYSKGIELYHGTDSKFTKFDPSKANTASGTGVKKGHIFYTDNKEVAGSYGKNIRVEKVSLDKPLVVDAKGMDWEQISHNGKTYTSNSLAELAQKQGYDGLVVQNVRDTGGRASGKPAGFTTSTVVARFDNQPPKSKPSTIPPELEPKTLNKAPINRPAEAEAARLKMDDAFKEVNDEAAKTGTVNARKWREANKLADDYWKTREALEATQPTKGANSSQNPARLEDPTQTKNIAVPPTTPRPHSEQRTPQVDPSGASAVPPLQTLAPRMQKQPQALESGLRDQPFAGNSTIKAKELPEYTHKNTSSIDKAFRSTRSIIERQGPSGKKLAGMLQGARDIEEQYLSALQKQMPTVTQIARKGRNALINKDFENFVEATQGLAQPKNAKIAQAVAEWQATHPQIRERAVGAGLDVGDLGPNYYPHFIDFDTVFKDKNKYNTAINHLVETGQAKSAEEAIKLLGYAKDISRNRQFGNLEASRMIDIPFYDKTPNSFISYLNGSAKRIVNTEVFGKGDELALKEIAEAGKQGYDTEAMKNAYDVAVGAKRHSPTTSKISSGVRKYITTTRLGLGALTNISQNVNTGIVTGHYRTMKSAIKQLDPEVRTFVEDTGVISDAVLNDLRTQAGYSSFSQKVLGKAINKITAPGFGAVEKMNRSIAATAGRDYALRLAQKGDEPTLRRLGVTGDIKNGSLSEAQQIQAARKVVEKTQFKIDPQDLPGWVDTPGGKLVAQFRTFSYNQSKFFSNEIIKPAAKGNLLPLGRLMAALPVGYALYETRRRIDGRPQEENENKVALAAFGKIGGAGLAFDLYQSLNPVGSKYIPSDRRTSMATGALGGPAVGVASQAIGAVSEAIQRKNTPTDAGRLDGKIAALNSGENYTDLTPAARFALQQIPIIGGPIKNRVLPYKKESDADKGTPLIGTGKASAATDMPVDKKDLKLAAFNNKESRELLKIPEKDRGQFVKDNPHYRGIYDQMKNFDKAFKNPEVMPEGMSEVSTKVLENASRLNENTRKNWESKLENKLAYEKAKFEKDDLEGTLDDSARKKRELNNNKLDYALQNGVKEANKVDELFEEPIHKFVLKQSEYEDRLDNESGFKGSPEEYKQREALQKMFVEKDYSKNAVGIYSMSESKIRDYLDGRGGTDKKTWDELVKLDKAMLAAGLIKNSKLDVGTGRKGRKAKGSKSKEIPGELLAKVTNVPSVGRARKAEFSVSAPPRGNLKRSTRKAIPKISTRPKALTVRRTT